MGGEELIMLISANDKKPFRKSDHKLNIKMPMLKVGIFFFKSCKHRLDAYAVYDNT